MAPSCKLPRNFYLQDTLTVARELLGMHLVHRTGITERVGRIVETEAYHQSEPACHAFAGLTRRTATLFGAPGRAYVYRSYGIHALFNAVCEPEGVGAAVLIRALHPIVGLEQITTEEPAECISAQVLQGLSKPIECPAFATRCTPESPLGAPMVSSEGACAAYYLYRRLQLVEAGDHG